MRDGMSSGLYLMIFDALKGLCVCLGRGGGPGGAPRTHGPQQCHPSSSTHTTLRPRSSHPGLARCSIARSALGTRRTREEASRTLVPSLHPQAQHALAATLSGALTALLSNPVDVIKTRMQLQQRWRAADAAGNAPALSAHGVYRNSWHAATTIWRVGVARQQQSRPHLLRLAAACVPRVADSSPPRSQDEGARAFMYGAGPRMLNRALKYAVVWCVRARAPPQQQLLVHVLAAVGPLRTDSARLRQGRVRADAQGPRLSRASTRPGP